MGSESFIRVTLSGPAGEDIVQTLASDTARAVYKNLHEDPKPPAGIAEELELTVQSVHYHIRNLEDAGLIRSVDTQYSEKGIEMTVYEAIPIEVVCPGSDTDEESRVDESDLDRP